MSKITVPTYMINLRHNFASQIYGTSSLERTKAHYFDLVDFDIKLLHKSCEPSNMLEFATRYPEVKFKHREKYRNGVHNDEEVEFKRDFSPTEKCIWYSQYDVWYRVAQSRRTSVVFEHDCVPLLDKPRLDFKRILEYDYFTFCAHILYKKTDEDGRHPLQVSEIAGYVLSPNLAKWVVGHCKDSWKRGGHCSLVNTDGAWAEMMRQARRENKFKIMTEEEGYAPGTVKPYNKMTPNLAFGQEIDPLLGNTIIHPKKWSKVEE